MHGSSEVIAKSVRREATSIDDELRANLIPHSHVTAAGVVVINPAQAFGYTLLTA